MASILVLVRGSTAAAGGEFAEICLPKTAFDCPVMSLSNVHCPLLIAQVECVIGGWLGSVSISKVSTGLRRRLSRHCQLEW